MDELLAQTVQDSLVSDVDIGMLLSGGVDSNLLYLLCEAAGKSITPFTIDWPQTEYSEKQFINELSAPRNLITINGFESLSINRLTESLLFYAQPIGAPFILCSEDLFHTASQNGLKVLLDGNGLDELFYGYAKYDAHNQLADPKIHQDGSMSVAGNLMGKNLRRKFDGRDLFHALSPYQSIHDNPADLDLYVSKVPRALRYSDQASMRFSCELRVPFLNRKLLEFARSAPREWLINEGVGKLPIRQLLARKISNSQFAVASKRPLQTPIREFFLHDWRDITRSIIMNSALADFGWIDPHAFIRKYDEFVANFNAQTSNSNFIWQHLNLAIWSARF